MRVEIIGGLGVGKTTLCTGLTRIGFRCVNENLGQNQYLSQSYQSPEEYGVYSQVSFVLGNYYTFKQNARPGEVSIFDYSIVNDMAYATLFLNDSERDAVLNVIDCLEQKEGRAELYLYLTCPADVQMQRIRFRNRDHERAVTQDFVERLDSNLKHYAAQMSESGAKIITIDTNAVDLLHDQVFIECLGRDIRAISGVEPSLEGFQPELGLVRAAE